MLFIERKQVIEIQRMEKSDIIMSLFIYTVCSLRMINYYTTGQAAKVLGVCVRTVQLWVEEGRIVFWKTKGGHRRLDRKSVDALVHSIPNEKIVSNVPEKQALSMRFLLVDDSKADTRLVRKLISKVSPQAEIEEADDGFEALVQIGRRCPDILVMDLAMPNMDGFQMLDTICEHQDAQHMLIFVTTSFDEDELKNRGRIPSIVRQVFHKPIDVTNFISVLNQSFKSSNN